MIGLIGKEQKRPLLFAGVCVGCLEFMYTCQRQDLINVVGDIGLVLRAQTWF